MSERQIYLNGRLVPYGQATIHIQSNAVKYGTSVFEGLRAYWSEAHQELYVFRLDDHVTRLLDSLRLMRMEHAFTREVLRESVRETLRANAFRQDVHVRQTAYLDADAGMEATGPVGLAVDALPRRLSDKPAVDLCVSSWSRTADGVMPPRIKCSANYQNGRLALMEARMNGYDSALLLNSRGKISEAPNAAVVIVRGGVAATPPLTADVLESITRASVLQLAKEKLGIPVVERDLDRTELYVSDEAFLCGTAWEIAAVATVDRLPLAGAPGPVTSALAKHYQAAARGADEACSGWLTPVYRP